MATLSERQPVPRVSVSAWRLPILDTYLVREMIGPFLFAFLAFLLFWGLNIFFLAADYIINQHAPFFLALRFVIFRIPQAIPMAFPFACLFAALLSMGRVMGDNEVTAMRTSGITVWRIAITPLLFGFAMFLVAYAMNEYVAPSSVDLSTRTFYQIIYHTDALPVEPQFFRKDPDTGKRLLRYSSSTRQQDHAGRANLQAGAIRSVDGDVASQERQRRRKRARFA